MHINRRAFMAGTAATLALAGGTGRSLAASKQMVVGNWGGDFADKVGRVVEQDFAAQHDVAFSYQFGDGASRRTKLLAERNLPRAGMDIAWLTDQDAYDVDQHDLLVNPLDLSRIPNYANVHETLQTPFYVPFLIQNLAVLYNPNKIPEPPTSYADLLDPRWAGKVGIMDLNFRLYVMIASLLETGELFNTDPAFAHLAKMKQTMQPKFYPFHEQLGQAFASEDIWIALNFTARGQLWKADGVPVEVAYPKEGMLTMSTGAAMPRKTGDEELAYAYLNHMLDPVVQGNFAAVHYFAPAVANAQIPEDMRAMVEIPAAELAKMRVVDAAEAGKYQAPWLDRWNREVK
jgi:putative spermidine/putrescine transport system substrate-binding protein